MIILGIGGNLGKRDENLARAVAIISDELLDDIKASSIITTPALMPEGAPAGWDIDFLNMAVSGELKHEITPLEFLAEVKRIETEIGRVEAPRWAPRVIDIDILAWGDEVVNVEGLQIPHIGLEHRKFAYAPLLELESGWVHPRFGVRLADLVGG